MKTYIPILAVVLFSSAVLAQEQVLLSGDLEHGGFGGPTFQLTQFDDQLGVMIGGHGGWISLDKKIEDQAHLFAGCFLMPPISISSLFRVITLDTLLAQKKKWGVSVGAMISQCSNANLIDEDQTLRLRKNMSFRKWRTREPYDDSMISEKPILFEKSIRLLLEHGGFKKTDIIIS